MTDSTMQTRNTKKTNKLLRTLGAAVFWLGVWFLLAAIVGKELLLPSPLSAAKALFSLAGKGAFWRSCLYSVLRILLAALLGTAAGVVFAVLTRVSRVCDALLSPFLRVLRATPVASFIILALLWLGRDFVPVIIAMLMVVPVVAGSLSAAIDETPRELLEMAKAYRVPKLRTVRKIYIPSVLPSFFSACVTSIGFAWKSGIAAEVLCLPRNAIGTRLSFTRAHLETPELFAWTAVVVLLSFVFEKGLRLLFALRVKK